MAPGRVVTSALSIGLLALACGSKPDEAAPRAVNPSPTPVAPAAPVASAAPTMAAISPPPARTTGPQCRQQAAQDFLLRKGQIAKIGAAPDERRAIEAARARSVEYRNRNYGRVSGFGRRSDNPHPPTFYAQRTTFMGLPLVLNKRVVPALACVEAALKRECAAQPYRPRTVGGIRGENTFKDYEVSNHVYGIALDIDPQLNPCCHCVGFWAENPVCRKRVSSPYERMAMPKCWVEVFERNGFHWLGHDELEDTMHFEFLGDPDRIFE